MSPKIVRSHTEICQHHAFTTRCLRLRMMMSEAVSTLPFAGRGTLLGDCPRTTLIQRLITQTGPEVADGCNFKLERRVNEISSLVASFPRDQSPAAGHVSRTQSAKLSISRSQVRTNEPQMYRAATFFLPRERKERKKRDREKKGGEGERESSGTDLEEGN